MKCPLKIKVCTRCNSILVACDINFTNNKDGKYGFKSICKKCYSESHKEEQLKDNPFINIDINKVWNHCPFCIKVCNKCKRILVANKNNFHRSKAGEYGVRSDCKICRRKKTKSWEENNKERRREVSKQWREDNPDKIFNYANKRRQLEENQGNGISKEQWLEMMKFFEWKCAYSGVTLNKNSRSIDHIIPLSKGGENEIWNLVPMHKSYNSQKNVIDMLEWYQRQEFYSEKRLNKIYEWIEYAKNKYKS